LRRVQGSGFRVQGFRVQGSGIRDQGSGIRNQGSGVLRSQALLGNRAFEALPLFRSSKSLLK
jgi:hypothetical protein